MEQALVVEQETLGVRRGEWKGLGEGRKEGRNSLQALRRSKLLDKFCNFHYWANSSSLYKTMSNVKVERNFITSLQGADPPHHMYACIPPLMKGPFLFLAFCRFCIRMLFSCRHNLKRVKSSMVFVGSEWFFAEFYKKSADPPLLSMGCNL